MANRVKDNKGLLRRRRRSGGSSAAFTVTFTGLTGGAALIGDHGSISYTIDPDNATDTAAWGASPGGTEYGTGTSPTDYTAGDGGTLYLQVTDGGETVTRSAPIQYTAPVAAGGLVDQSFGENSGVQTYDASVDFTGSAITYSVNSVTGVTINSGTGVVSFDTDAMALQTGTSIVVTATNSGGSDTSGFSLAITDVDAIAPVVNSATYDDPTQTVSLNITEVSGSVTVYWATVTGPTNEPSQAQIEAGSGGGVLDSGSFLTSGGDSTISVQDETADEIHLFARDASSNDSTPTTVITGVVLDSTLPTITSVATSTDGTYADITFDEPMDSGVPNASAFVWAQTSPTNTPVSQSVAWQSTTVLRVNVSPSFQADA